MRPLLAALTLLAASCSSPFEPAELAGTYTASRMNGNALPFTFNVGVQSFYVIADSLILRADGTGRYGAAMEVVDMELDTRTMVRNTGEFVYSISGSTLLIMDADCPDICAAILYPAIEYRILDGHLLRGGSSWQRRVGAE